MKKLFILSLLLLVFFTCGCKKNKKIIYEVNYHFADVISRVEQEENSLIGIEPFDADNYMFFGWFDKDYKNELTNKPVVSNIDVYAKIVRKGVAEEIEYLLDGGEFLGAADTTYTVGYEKELPKPSKGEKFEFLGWDYNGTVITKISSTMYGKITLTAKWADHNVYHNITYVLDGGEYSDSSKVKYYEGETYHLSYPKKEYNVFDGWFLDSDYTKRVYNLDDLTEDITLYARWKDDSRSNLNISFFGDSITTFEGYMPEGYLTYYPQGDVQKVEDTWWYQVTKGLHLNLLMNDSYSGSKVVNGPGYGASDERVKNLSKDGVDPDYVIIHMGDNDFTNRVDSKLFIQMFKVMIEKILYWYDDVEIYVCTFPANLHPSSYIAIRNQFNDIIRDIVTEYNLHLLDLDTIMDQSNCFNYLYAGAHPNKAGMRLMSDYIIDVINRG